MHLPTRPDPEDVDRDEIEAVLETRRELGTQYEPALVDSFAEKTEHAIDARGAERTGGRDVRRPSEGDVGGLPGLIVAWAGIVGINVAHAWQSRRG